MNEHYDIFVSYHGDGDFETAGRLRHKYMYIHVQA